MEITFIT